MTSYRKYKVNLTEGQKENLGNISRRDLQLY